MAGPTNPTNAERCRAIAADQKTVERLQEILKAENPCAIKVKSGEVSCRGGQPCCQGCSYLGANGCTVRSVACMFYFCEVAWAALPDDAQAEIKALGAAYHGRLRNRFDGVILESKPPFIW